ncbi:hypothetical protein JCM10207_002391 [Rhodosporidiobolus poonsookiae]
MAAAPEGSLPVPPSVASKLTATEKYHLITQNLAEVLGAEQLEALLKERDAICYWGTAPTGRPHLGYFVPLAKIADFLTAGVQVKVLLADVHAFLDNLKAPIELVEARVEYYRRLITAVFRSLNLPINQLTFVVGSSYQYDANYNLDKYKLASITSEHDARKAGAEVVKQVSSPLLSGLLYPLLQALDEQYLGVDFQFGGVDQRKIFTYAEQYLPKIGYTKRSHLMNLMVPGLSGGKMSSSDPNSKIDFLDPPASVKSKIQKAHCAPGEVEGNGVLAFLRHVVVPIGELFRGQGRADARPWVHADAPADTVFTVEGNAKFGGSTRHFRTIDELDDAYAKGEVHPGDLKTATTNAINALLAPIQAEFAADKEFQAAETRAYPPEVKVAPKKKEKKYTPKPEHLMTPEEKERAAQKDKEFAEKEAKKQANKSGLNETEALREAVVDTLSQ